MALLNEFEEDAAWTPFLRLVKPFLYDNVAFLYDNPERLCTHYTESWADHLRPITLAEEREMAARFTDQRLSELWRAIVRSERKIYFLGK